MTDQERDAARATAEANVRATVQPQPPPKDWRNGAAPAPRVQN